MSNLKLTIEQFAALYGTTEQAAPKVGSVIEITKSEKFINMSVVKNLPIHLMDTELSMIRPANTFSDICLRKAYFHIDNSAFLPWGEYLDYYIEGNPLPEGVEFEFKYRNQQHAHPYFADRVIDWCRVESIHVTGINTKDEWRYLE